MLTASTECYLLPPEILSSPRVCLTTNDLLIRRIKSLAFLKFEMTLKESFQLLSSEDLAFANVIVQPFSLPNLPFFSFLQIYITRTFHNRFST
jgi:hypothetical protein